MADGWRARSIDAAKLAARTSGDSTVAYSCAFARAVEAALGIEVPPRAVWLRALMAELERLANHLGDIGAICNDALVRVDACAMRAAARTHAADSRRLFRPPADDGPDRSGRCRRGPDRRRRERVRALMLSELSSAFPPLVGLYDETASLQDRTVGTGRVDGALAHRSAAGGYVGRASGPIGFDARRSPGYAPYDELDFSMPVCHRGRRQRPRLGPHQGGRSQPGADRADAGKRLPAGESTLAHSHGRAARAWLWWKAFRGEIMTWVAVTRRWYRDALPPARPVLVPVAAAGSRDRGQHRRGFPALQQVASTAPIPDTTCSVMPCVRPSARKPHARPAHLKAGRSPTRPAIAELASRLGARRTRAWAAACRSARSMPVRAMAASWKSTRSTTRSTIWNASAFASWHRPATPMS